MIVLGIDPGIATTGCALVKEENNKIALVFEKAIITLPEYSLAQRLNLLYDELTVLIKEYKPDAASLETLFFHTNVTNAFTVGQARGIIVLALTQNKIPITEYNPMEVKVAVTGSGSAKKDQMQRMVMMILKLKSILKPDDVADAAAIALTHCFSYKMKKQFLK